MGYYLIEQINILIKLMIYKRNVIIPRNNVAYIIYQYAIAQPKNYNLQSAVTVNM